MSTAINKIIKISNKIIKISNEINNNNWILNCWDSVAESCKTKPFCYCTYLLTSWNLKLILAVKNSIGFNMRYYFHHHCCIHIFFHETVYSCVFIFEIFYEIIKNFVLLLAFWNGWYLKFSPHKLWYGTLVSEIRWRYISSE